MRAALTALRKRDLKGLVLAVPVAPAETISRLRREVDRLICLAAPERFAAVGHFYEDFRQVTNDEVTARFP